MKSKITNTETFRKALTIMVLAFIFIFLNATITKSQTVFWTENFTNNCSSGCLVSSYTTGPNGAWTWMSTGTNNSFANTWFVSCAENGNAVGDCGTSCTSNNATLHVGNVAGSPLSTLFCPTGDCGAAYDAGITDGSVKANARAASPTINCTGKYSIHLNFNYMADGDTAYDYARIDYYDGITWSTLQQIAFSDNTACIPQGTWTAYPMVILPASANNNPNVKIGFNWTNNDDAMGGDPSIAIDSVRLSYLTTTGVAEENTIANSLNIFPNPATGVVHLNFITNDNSSLKLNILNPEGQTVYTSMNDATTGEFNKMIDLKDLAKGIYFIQIITDKESVIRKIVLQ